MCPTTVTQIWEATIIQNAALAISMARNTAVFTRTNRSRVRNKGNAKRVKHYIRTSVLSLNAPLRIAIIMDLVTSLMK